VITIGIIAKKTPQIIEIYEEKKLKAKLIYVRHSLICCHLKKKKSQKNIRYMGTISLIYSPTWGLMVKKIIFHHIQAY